MQIHGYEVIDFKLVVDGQGNLVDAERTCDCCLSSDPKILKASLEGLWEEVKVCTRCMVKGGLFHNYNDLMGEAESMIGGRGRG